MSNTFLPLLYKIYNTQTVFPHTGFCSYGLTSALVHLQFWTDYVTTCGSNTNVMATHLKYCKQCLYHSSFNE